MCIAIYLNVETMSKTVVVTLDSRPSLAVNARIIGNIASENKKITVTNLIGINGYYIGWDAILHLWLPILSVVLTILAFCIPFVRFCWLRAYKKLDSELRTVLSGEIQRIQLANSENFLEQVVNHPIVTEFNEVCAERIDQIAAMSAEIDEYRAQIAKLEKSKAKSEGQLIRYKKNRIMPN